MTFWIVSLPQRLVCSSSIFRYMSDLGGRHRMWVTGNPSQMSLPYFKTVSTLLSTAEAHSSLHSTPNTLANSQQPPSLNHRTIDGRFVHHGQMFPSLIWIWLIKQWEPLVLWPLTTLTFKNCCCAHFMFMIMRICICASSLSKLIEYKLFSVLSIKHFCNYYIRLQGCTRGYVDCNCIITTLTSWPALCFFVNTIITQCKPRPGSY